MKRIYFFLCVCVCFVHLAFFFSLFGNLVYLWIVIFSGYQTEIKERTTACLKLGDTPVSGYLMLAIIHDHVDLVRKPIIGKLGDHTPNGTPFTVTSVKHPDSTSYEPFEVEFIGLFLNSYIYRICSTFRSNVRIYSYFSSSREGTRCDRSIGRGRPSSLQVSCAFIWSQK